MGNGGPSKQPKGKSKNKYVSTLKEVQVQGHVKPQGAAKGPPTQKAEHEYAQKDCAWHRAHCKDEYFQHATSIREAYPFDENALKDVKEAQRPLVASASKYSSTAQGIKVIDAGPRTLNCDVCGVWIANRLESEPFYFCRNCKANGRKLEICLRCHREGKLGQGQAQRQAEVDPFETREEKERRHVAPRRLSITSAVETGSRGIADLSELRTPNSSSSRPPRSVTPDGPRPANMLHSRFEDPLGSGARQSGRAGSSPQGGRLARSASPSPPSPPPPNLNVGLRSPSKGATAQALPSGIWIGTIVEDNSARQINRELTFHDGGNITGSGASTDPGATISGKVLVGKMKISWVEVHSWGRSKVEGTFLWSRDGSCIIKANFHTTDESTGMLELTGPRT